MSQQLITISVVNGDNAGTYKVPNRLNNNLSNRAKIINASIVRNWNNVQSGSSIIVDTVNTITVPEGYLTIADLVSYLDTQFKTVDANYSVTFNDELNRMVISNAGGVDLTGVGPYSRFAGLTGFSNLPVIAGTSVTASDAPILSQGYISVTFNGSESNVYVNENKQQEGQFSLIIPPGTPFAIENFSSQNFGNCYINIRGSEFDIKLRAQYSGLNLSGLELSILLELE